MKIFNQVTSMLLLALFTMTGCEHNVVVESGVNEDGSIDRAIVFMQADSIKARHNMFNAKEENGWEVKMEEMKKPADAPKDSNKEMKITFQKHFPSAEEANLEMNSRIDTLFQIESGFQKEFRWFYTYISYSDKYTAINRFQDLPKDDYFTQEDYAFIDRLPAEGKSITKADSLYLSRLNEKIFDHYATRAFYEESFNLMAGVLEMNRVEGKWSDSLTRNKEKYYRQLVAKDDADDDFILTLIDSLHIPLSIPKAREDYKVLSAGLEQRIDFMSEANEGKYTHVIKMPWKIVRTNADSVSGSSLYWRPPVTKFLLKDYIMYAESRKLNYWALIVSGVVIVGTVLLFRRRSRFSPPSQS